MLSKDLGNLVCDVFGQPGHLLPLAQLLLLPDDIRYSRFINGLKKANIQLNRKMLSEIAIADPAGFDAIVEKAKAAVES